MHPAKWFGFIFFSKEGKGHDWNEESGEEGFHFGGNDRKERSNDIWNKDRND